MESLYIFFQRNRLLRYSLCLFLAVALVFVSSSQPLVVAQAVAIPTAGIIAVVGSLFAMWGITFVNVDQMNRTALSFYNKSSSAVKQWIDSQVLQFPGNPPEGGGDNDPGSSPSFGWGNAVTLTAVAAATIGAAIVNFFKRAPDAPPVVEDTSYWAGANPVDNWRQFKGKTLGAFSDAMVAHYGSAAAKFQLGLPIPIILNSVPDGKDLPSTMRPIPSTVKSAASAVYGDSTFYFPSPVQSSNIVFRVLTPAGTPLDYQLRLVHFTGDYFAGCPLSFELTQNGSSAGFISISKNYTDNTNLINLLGVGAYVPFINGVADPFSIYINFSDSKNNVYTQIFTGRSSVSSTLSNVGASKDCTIFGLVDTTTDALQTPTTTYQPSTLSDNAALITAALEQYFIKNPSGLQITIPTSDLELITAPWTKIVEGQTQYIEELERRLSELENPNPDPRPDPKPDPEPLPNPNPDLGDIATDSPTVTDPIKDFTGKQLPPAMDAIDPTKYVMPPSFLRASLWFSEQVTKSFNAMGDFKNVVLFPVYVGVVMLLIGRGGQAAMSTAIRRSGRQARYNDTVRKRNSNVSKLPRKGKVS